MPITISIAMCTCNGEYFLREQLESIAAQSMQPFELVVCDDRSEDSTLTCLYDFAGRAGFSVRIFENERRLGFADNFFNAARLCRGEWIAFCDQDDIWLPGKLEAAKRAIEANDEVGLILQNSFICRSDLSHDGKIFPDKIKPGKYPPGGQYGFWVWPGFLQVVRADFFRQVPNDIPRPRSYYPGHSFMTHDKWTCMMANASGGVIVLREPEALYRRHDSTITGDYAVQGARELISQSVAVGESHYGFLAEVARETAEYLRTAAQRCAPEMARDLCRSAVGFERIAEIQSARAAVYASGGFFARSRACLKVLWLGGYFGSSMTAMGWRSAAKDVLAIFRLLGRQQENVA